MPIDPLTVFTAPFLTGLAANLAANMLQSAGRTLKGSLGGSEKTKAFKRCVEAAVTAAVAKAGAISKKEKKKAEKILRKFFEDKETARELIGIMDGKAPKMIELEESFRLAGYNPQELPSFDVRKFVEGFKAGFVEAAENEPTIMEIVKVSAIIRQTNIQLNILNELRGLSAYFKNPGKKIYVAKGAIIVVDAETRKGTRFLPVTAETPSQGELEPFYLNHVVRICDFLDLADLDRDCSPENDADPSRVEDQTRRVSISDVFTTLYLEGPGRLPDQSVAEAIVKQEKMPDGEGLREMRSMGENEKEEKRVPIQAAEACGALDRIVVLGRPGGGKSTLVKHLAASLARNRKGEKGEKGEKVENSPVSRWRPELQKMLPVVVVLRRFAAWLPEKPVHPGEEAGLVWKYIDHMLDAMGCAEFAKNMRIVFDREGGAVFFDGLDEVGHSAEDSKRELILKAIRNFAHSLPQCRVIVTCREYAYRENPDKGAGKANAGGAWRLPEKEFPPATLALFNADQIRFFTRAWYESKGVFKGWDKAYRESLAKQLDDAILHSDNLKELGQYPLLLTLMAQVHGRDGTLPQDRAELYERVVTLLTIHWQSRVARESKADCPLKTGMVPSLDIRADQLGKALERAALFAHQQQEKSEGRRSGCADIDIKDLREMLAEEFGGDFKKAEEAIAYIQLRAGLLQANENKTFSFPHRTFQEYLAATAIGKMQNFEAFMKECLLRDAAWWKEVFLLAVGSCRKHPLQIYYLLDCLLPEGPDTGVLNAENCALACLAAEAMGETRFDKLFSSAGQAGDGRSKKMFLRVRAWLLAAMAADNVLTPKQRADAGNALNHIGDPRFDPKWWRLPAEKLWGFVMISKGPFRMGSDKKRDPKANKNEFPLHTVHLSRYAIGKYPVTVAQYRVFLEDSKKDPDEDWKEANQYDNHPVVVVSWHDAKKYCEWLAGKFESVGWKVRLGLPTEAQWEKAARSTDGRIYPWGDEADPDKANYGDTGLGTTSAVGCFPSGTSPYGLQEMSGNVWEWCEDSGEGWGYAFKTDTYKEGITDPVGREGSVRVLRGGSWGFVAANCRAANRYGDGPSHRNRVHGFRLVLLECWRASA